MDVTIYPAANYDSWISLKDANEYMLKRLHTDTWTGTLDDELIMALQMSFRTMQELNIDLTNLDSTDSNKVAAILQVLKRAQCEQALYELENMATSRDVSSLGLGGLINVNFNKGSGKVSRYSDRAVAILRDYLKGNVTERYR